MPDQPALLGRRVLRSARGIGITGELWLKSGDATVYRSNPDALASLDLSTLRIHYQRSDANFTPWGLHLWDTSRIDAARLPGLALNVWDNPVRFASMPGYQALSQQFWYVIAAGIAIIVYLVCRGVVKSRAGRSLVAVRDNETAAAVMGVNLVAAKAFAFGISAGLCALPGSVTAIRLGSVSPDIATLTVLGSLTFLIIMVIGGAGSLWGPVIGSALYVFVTDRTGGWADDENIPGLLKPFFSWSKVPPGTGIFAVILIVLMFVAPRGIVGLWKQYSPRVVRIVPRPAGVAVAEQPALVATEASTTPDTPEGESE